MIEYEIRTDWEDFYPSQEEMALELLGPNGNDGVATSFRRFLDFWKFIDQDTGIERVLGEVLWPAQEEFVSVAQGNLWVYYLKARQLGETTIECAFDGWVARFRDPLARVHVLSQRDEEAMGLLEAVKHGLVGMPERFHLPVLRDTSHEFRIGYSDKERRMVKAYPTSKNPSRGATCTHAHVDELAAMADPRAVWRAVEPTAARSCHILTTGVGPQDESAAMWRRALAGDIKDRNDEPMAACFIGALERPDRTPAWLKNKRAGMTEEDFRREYAMTWEDALFGGGDFVFTSKEVDHAAEDARGFKPPTKGRKYVKSWDIGQTDAAVGTVLEIDASGLLDVVAYKRMRGISYPTMQYEIEAMHKLYPGLTVIEDNAMGKAVRENLNIPEHELEGFSTTKPSKARIIQQLKLGLQGWAIKWNPDDCPQLDVEVRGYMLPDDNVVQDSVMSLAIGVEYAPMAYSVGKLGTTLRI